ncbi:MAG: FMN-binding protein [Pseudomonadota bacterium]
MQKHLERRRRRIAVTIFAGYRTACSVFFLMIIELTVVTAYFFPATTESVMGHQAPFDLPQMKDGTYRGSHTIADSEYAVDITITTHEIKEISVIRGPKRIFTQKCGLCEAIAMIKKVIATQSLPVDAYSGATQTTTAVLRAIEEALMTEIEWQENSPPTEAWR